MLKYLKQLEIVQFMIMQRMDLHLEQGMIYIFEITLIQLMEVIQMETILLKFKI